MSLLPFKKPHILFGKIKKKNFLRGLKIAILANLGQLTLDIFRAINA